MAAATATNPSVDLGEWNQYDGKAHLVTVTATLSGATAGETVAVALYNDNDDSGKNGTEVGRVNVELLDGQTELSYTFEAQDAGYYYATVGSEQSDHTTGVAKGELAFSLENGKDYEYTGESLIGFTCGDEAVELAADQYQVDGATADATLTKAGAYTGVTVTLKDKAASNWTLGGASSIDFDIVLSGGQEAANKAWAGYEVTTTAGDDEAVFEETGSAVDFGVESVKTVDKTQTLAEGDYEVLYYKKGAFDASWTLADNADDLTNFFADKGNLCGGDGSAPEEIGDYVMAVLPSEDYLDGALSGVTVPQWFHFEIVQGAATDEPVYALYQENESDAKDVSDTTFVYNGANFFNDATATVTPGNGLKLAIDGKPATLGDSTGEYKLKATKQVKAAGTYQIEVVKGDDESHVAYVDMTVEKFDVSKATVSVKDTTVGANAGQNTSITADLTYNGATISAEFADGVATVDAVDEALSLAVDSYEPAIGAGAPAGYKGLFGYAGAYGFSVSAAASNGAFKNASLEMSGDPATGEVRMLKNGADIEKVFSYKGDKVYDADGTDPTKPATVTIDKSMGKAFDAEEISWDSGAVNYDGKNAVVTITDEATGEVVADASAAGLYKVSIQLATGVQYDKGGSGYFFVKVLNGSATVYFTVDGKPASKTAEVTEDGAPVPVAVVVKADDEAKTVLKEGTDYTVEVRDEDANKVVDEIVEAGNYTVTVKGAGYQLDETSIAIKVLPMAYDGLEIAEQQFGYDGADYQLPSGAIAQQQGIPWTGEAVVPTVRAYAEKEVDGEAVRTYFDIDPSVYSISYKDKDGKAVKAEDLKDAGDYTATVKVDKEDFESAFGKGATIKGGWNVEVAFSIVKNVAGFSDVTASDWFADEVVKAKQLGYVEGYGSAFAPNANITRADFAMILARTAGVDTDLAGSTYPSKFSDVEADAYYAKAVDWAFKTGAVNGKGDAEFGTFDYLTREEAATMLYRAYANGAQVDESALDQFADAGSVSGWAKAAMAWCVEEGYMNGVGEGRLDPQGTTTRAQIAALAVRVVPAEEKVEE